MPLKLKAKKAAPATNEPPAYDEATKPMQETKEMLLEELEAANKRALEAEKELHELKERECLKEAADKVAQMRDAFIAAGFTREEAMALIRSTLESALGGCRKH